MNRDRLRRARRELVAACRRSRSTGSASLRRSTRSSPVSCPSTGAAGTPSTQGTVLFTGSLNRNIGCSGTWLADLRVPRRRREQVVVPGPQRPARRRHQPGNPRRSLPQRPAPFPRGVSGSATSYACPSWSDGAYWARRGPAHGTPAEPWFTEDDVRCLAALSEPIADAIPAGAAGRPVGFGRPLRADGPGVVVFDGDGSPESHLAGAPSTGSGRWSRFPPPVDPSRVQDRPGGRCPSPHRRPRPGPAADRRPVPGADQVGRVAAAVRHPAGRAAPATAPPSSSSLPPRPPSLRWSRSPTDCPSESPR